jgi:hypothetical protein
MQTLLQGVGYEEIALPQVEKPSSHIRKGHVAAVRLATVVRIVILHDAASHGRTGKNFQLLQAHDLERSS